jgi:transcriptional regulator with XRE-family HTH domain
MVLTKLRQRRQEKNYSQEFMASLVGCTHAVYGRKELGKNEFKLIEYIRISRFLGFDLFNLKNELFDENLLIKYTDKEIEDIIINTIRNKRIELGYNIKYVASQIGVTDVSLYRKEKFEQVMRINETNQLFVILDIDTITE